MKTAWKWFSDWNTEYFCSFSSVRRNSIALHHHLLYETKHKHFEAESLESDRKLKSEVLSIYFKLSGIDGDINCCPYSHVQCSKNNVSNFDEYIIQWNIGFAFSQPYVLLKRIHLRRIGVFIGKRDKMWTTFAFDRREENKDSVITPNCLQKINQKSVWQFKRRLRVEHENSFKRRNLLGNLILFSVLASFWASNLRSLRSILTHFSFFFLLICLRFLISDLRTLDWMNSTARTSCK